MNVPQKLFPLLFATALCVSPLAISGGSPIAEGQTESAYFVLSGHLMHVDAGDREIAVAGPTGEEERISVGQTAEILLNGDQVPLDELNVGLRVLVQAEHDTSGWVATRVDAREKY